MRSRLRLGAAPPVISAPFRRPVPTAAKHALFFCRRHPRSRSRQSSLCESVPTGRTPEGLPAAARKRSPMPRPHPAGFRERAVASARAGDRPVGKIAKGPRMSRSRPRNCMRQADADDALAGADRLCSAETKKLVELRRRNRQSEMDVDVLKPAAAYFAQENTLPSTQVPATTSTTPRPTHSSAAGRAPRSLARRFR